MRGVIGQHGASRLIQRVRFNTYKMYYVNSLLWENVDNVRTWLFWRTITLCK